MTKYPNQKEENWKNWWKGIKKAYKRDPEETQWVHLFSLGYVKHMFYINKNAKEWWHKSDIYSLCQNGKDDINNIFEDCNTLKILQKGILGIKNRNQKFNNRYRKKI